MGAFVTMAPGAPVVAATCLGANTVLSFMKGYTTTSAIGGADMRKSDPFIESTWSGLTDHSRCYYCAERLFWICPGCRRFHAQ